MKVYDRITIIVVVFSNIHVNCNSWDGICTGVLYVKFKRGKCFVCIVSLVTINVQIHTFYTIYFPPVSFFVNFSGETAARYYLNKVQLKQPSFSIFTKSYSRVPVFQTTLNHKTMEDRHTVSEPRVCPTATDKNLAWEVDVYRENVPDPIETLRIDDESLPPRMRKGKVVWRLPTEPGKLVSMSH